MSSVFPKYYVLSRLVLCDVVLNMHQIFSSFCGYFLKLTHGWNPLVKGHALAIKAAIFEHNRIAYSHSRVLHLVSSQQLEFRLIEYFCIVVFIRDVNNQLSGAQTANIYLMDFLSRPSSCLYRLNSYTVG
jgi:hypothetical protein